MSSPGCIGACASSSPVGVSLAAALNFFAASLCLLEEPWPRDAQVGNGSRFDFIIVGAGTAGCALAARLAEVDAFTVLLVEAGGDPPQESIIPAFRDTLKSSPYDWNFTTVNDGYSSQGLAGGSQRQPRGMMLGGSGSLNDMVYARGHPTDYDEWADTLGDVWSWANVLEYFKKTEQMTDEKIINNPELMQYHDVNGEIEVTGSNDTEHLTKNFLEAFEELGFEIVDDMTNPHQIGAGRFSHTVRKGRRDSSLTALLNNIKSKNLFVQKNALTTNILIENNVAVGIEVISNDENMQFFANKEVILSAGTFNTPKLLLMSGIGAKEHLEQLEIDMVQDLPVGDNLHDHVMVLTYIAVDNGTCPVNEEAIYFDTLKYLYDRSGSLSRTDSMGAYVSFNPNQPNVADFAIYPSCSPRNTDFKSGCTNVLGFSDDICSKLDEVNQSHDLLAVAVVLLKPKSRGKVTLSSNNPYADPLIYSGLFSDPEDLEGFPNAITIARSLAETAYFQTRTARIVNITGGTCVNELDDLKCEAKSLAMPAWHAVGTAAMGSVVDKHLKVFGVNNLRVVDASVMPKVIRGNTNAPVVMIAEKAADFIKEEHCIN